MSALYKRHALSNTSLGAADRMLLFRAMGSIWLRDLRELAV